MVMVSTATKMLLGVLGLANGFQARAAICAPLCWA